MSIEKTPYGTWRVRWRDATGKQRARSFPRKVDATAFNHQIIAARNSGDHLPARATTATVSTVADEWLTASRRLARATVTTYRRDLDRYILPALGDARLDRLTPEAIDAYIGRRIEDGAAVSSVRRERATLSRLCSWAVSRGRLRVNPTSLTEAPEGRDREMRFLTAGEVERLADGITPPPDARHPRPDGRYRALILVAAWGGLRWSELVGLRPDDVDGDTISVRSQLLRDDDGWYRAEPKSRAGTRRVTLPQSVAGELASHIDTWSVAEGPQGPLVFPNRNGAPIIASSWRTSHWAKALRRASLDANLRPHDLRHTAVALAIAAGAHPKTIQARMGHASISVTLDRYGHLFPDLADNLAAGLDRLRLDS